jgi:hypothetical protein
MMSESPTTRALSDQRTISLQFTEADAEGILDFLELRLGHNVGEAPRDLYRRLHQELRNLPQGEPMRYIPGVNYDDGVMTVPPQPVRPIPDRMPRVGIVQRTVDVTGISGVGHIAEVCEFSDGKGVIRWLGGPPQNEPKLEFYDNLGIEPFLKISGHNGNTKVIWLDEIEQDA